MENTPLEPNEELLKILGDIDFVSVEEAKRKRGKRSSILKRPKKSDDDIETEETGGKNMGARRRVSFAEKFQVMEMNTGNIYDVSGKGNSPSNKDAVQNEATCSESNLGVPSQENFSSIMDISSKDLPISSSTNIMIKRNESTSTFLTKKHPIDTDCNLQPDRKKISTENFHPDQKSEPDFSSDISEYKNYLFNTSKNLTLFNERKLNTELTCNQNLFLNKDPLQSCILNRYIGDENKLTSNNYGLSKFDKIIQQIDMPFQSDNIFCDEKNRSFIKDTFKEFESRDSYFKVFEEKSLNIKEVLPNVDLYPVSLSNVPLSENKENLFLDIKSKNILCTNARQVMAKDVISQISQDVKSPMNSHTSNQASKIPLSEVNPQKSEKDILEQISSEDRSDTDKTCILNNSMDLTCVSDMNTSNNSECSEEIVCKDLKPTEKGMFHSNKLNKTVFDSSQYMDLTCNPENFMAMQDSMDGSVKDISSFEPARLAYQQKEDVIHESSVCYQFKDDKTVCNTSHYMDLTCNPQNFMGMQGSMEGSVKDISSSEPARLAYQQNGDVIHKSSVCYQLKDDKTVCNTSQYMDLTCYPHDITTMEESLESNAEDAFIPESTNLKLQQNKDLITKNSFSSQPKDNKTIFDTSDPMDLTCNLQNRTVMQTTLNESEENVPEPPLLMSKQNENVTLENQNENEFKSYKTVFDSSHYTDLNFKDTIKTFSKVPRNCMENVSESSNLITQQNDITDKYKTVFDPCYMDLTCNPQDLRGIEPNSSEYNVKDVSVSKPLKQSVCLSSKITLNNGKTRLDSSEMDFNSLQGSRTGSVELLDNMKDVSAQSSKCITEEDNEVPLSKKRKKDVKDIKNTDKNEKNVAGVLYCNQTQIPCGEKNFSEDNAFTLKSTSVPPEQHLISNNDSDKENIIVFSNASIPNQIQNRKKIVVLNDSVDDQEINRKSDFSNCMGVTGNVKGLRDNLTESHKNRFNLASSPDSFESSSKESVKQNENMTLQNCALKIASSSVSTKNKSKDPEMPFVSADILKSQTDNEISNTSLKNQSIQKLKDFGIITENVSSSIKNKKLERDEPYLPKDSIAKTTHSFPSVHNPQKLGNYMFAKTDVRKSEACEKVDAYKGKNLNIFNPNLFLGTQGSNNEFEGEATGTLTSKGNLFKIRTDAEVEFAVLSEENSRKQGENVDRENTKESQFSNEVEKKADEKVNSDKMDTSATVEIPNKISRNEAKEDNFLNCKGSMANDVKFEQDKQKNTSDPDILYAIKQIKCINQPVLTEQNIVKFPEVFLSVKKKFIPPKPPFSCSSIQFSKAIKEYTRRSSNIAREELSFASDSKHNILSKHNYMVMNSDQNLPRISEKPCDSEPFTHCDIPSTSQVITSTTKIIQRKTSISYQLSPKQIQDEEFIPQIDKESSNFNLSLGNLDSLKRSLNFDNEVTTTLPKILVSSSTGEITDFAKNSGVFSDNSEFLLENCSINLVSNDDSFDSKILKQSSKLDGSKSSVPNEILLSEGKSMENKEMTLQISQHKIEKDDDERGNIFLNNSDVEMKSNSIDRFQESGKGVVFDNSFLRKSFDSGIVENQKRKSNATEEPLEIEQHKVIKPLSVSNFKTNKESCKSVSLVRENQSLLEAQNNINESLQAMSRDKPKERHNSDTMHSQCFLESNEDLEISKGTKDLSKKKLESYSTSGSPSSTLKTKCNNKNNVPFKECNLQELKQNYITTTSMEVDDNSEVYTVDETNVENRLILDKSKLSNQVENIYHDSFVEKENSLQATSKDRPKQGHNSSAMIHSQCFSESNEVFDIPKGKKDLLKKELESHNMSGFPLSTRKIKYNENNVSFKECNFQEIKQNYMTTTSMEVHDNLEVYTVNETNVENQLILDKSNQVENMYHDSSVEKENNCIVRQKVITEVTIVEKHLIADKLENEVSIQTPSKLLIVKNNEEKCDVFVTSKQNPYLQQGNLIEDTKLSVSNLNEQSVDNNERSKNNGNNCYINESVVQKSFELLRDENINDHHPAKMTSGPNTGESQIIKKVTNCTLNKSIKGSSTAELPKTLLLPKTKNVDNQYEQNNSHKQDSSAVNIEITVNDRSNNQDANSNKSQNCPLNLIEDNENSLMLVNDGNLDTTKTHDSKVTKHDKKLVSTKRIGHKRKKDSSSSHNSESQSEKIYPSYDHTEIQVVNKKACSPRLDAEKIPSRFEDDYEKFHTLRKKLNEASEKNNYLWCLREMDDKQAVFEILPESIFACYLLSVPLDLNGETTSSTKISFNHLKSETDERDGLGFLLFKSYATSEIILSPFSTDEFIKSLSKFVEYALLAKSLIRDIWLTAIDGKIVIDTSQEIPKLTVTVFNFNNYSLFNLTFAIDLKSYPREKIIPTIDHLNDDNTLSSETILNALKEVEPGEKYLSHMVEAAHALL